MKILITGATGLLGKGLIKQLSPKYELYAVATNKSHIKDIPPERCYSWNALKDEKFPSASLKNCDVIIHLAGTPLAEKRWNQKIKQDILDSRIKGTQQLVKALADLNATERPQTFISASAVGFYGNSGSKALDETSSPQSSDFLSEVVQRWEQEARAAEVLGIRTVLLRTAMVLSGDGGALSKMPPVIIGDGKNYMSWIHISDWVQAVEAIIRDKKYTGPVNMCAPQAEPQAVFIKALAQAKKVPLVLRAPKFVVQVALGEMIQVVLASQNIIPKKLLNLGFQFQFKNIEAALTDIFKVKKK